MQPDLTKPGAAEAFDRCVSLYIKGCADDDPAPMIRAGLEFRALHRLAGGDREALLQSVIDAAALQVRTAAGLRRAS